MIQVSKDKLREVLDQLKLIAQGYAPYPRLVAQDVIIALRSMLEQKPSEPLPHFNSKLYVAPDQRHSEKKEQP
jgi:hypothetical protein